MWRVCGPVLQIYYKPPLNWYADRAGSKAYEGWCERAARLADGQGGFWATGVPNRIGHANSLNYYRNYLGWKAGNSN